MSDPHYDKVVLLLPMLGTPGATGASAFPDYSQYKWPLTMGTNATISADQSVYYGTSAYTSGPVGTGARYDMPNTSLAITNHDFTAEAWCWWNSLIAFDHSPSFVNPGANFQAWNFFFATTSLRLFFRNTSSQNKTVTASFTPEFNRWYHVAVARASGTVRFFVDGAQVGDSHAVPDIFEARTIMQVWASASVSSFDGYLQDLRVTRGVARYTTTFTPPSRTIGTVSGIVRDDQGDPAIRRVYAIPRSAPTQAFGPVMSAADGTYSLLTPATETVRVVLDDAAGTVYNDKIDRVLVQ